MKITTLVVAASICLSSCQTILHPRAIEAPDLAAAKHAADFDTYHLGRVGVLPTGGGELSYEESIDLQTICFNEFNQVAGFELVMLTNDDLAEVEISDPYRRGFYKGETVLDISRRFNLDGLLVGSVSQRQNYPPQKLNMQVDLVASETGMTIWSSSIALQADRPVVERGVEAFYGNGQPISDDSWAGALLSPSKFARFGMWQMARRL